MKVPTTFARRLGAALCAIVLAVGSTAVVPAAVAHADCTSPGDYGAGSGCPPPGDTSGSGGGGDSWPPTSVDWPPSQDSSSGGNAGKSDASTPIVMPDGQEPSPTAHSVAKDTGTSTPPTPIVPVNAPVAGPAPSAIVMPTSSGG